MELLEFKDKGFNRFQLEEIQLGIESGFSEEQLALYARVDFNRYQMCQIRVGVQNGLNREQLEVFATPVYDEAQMSVLRVAFELGMSSKEVSEFANPKLTWQEMWRKRVKIWQSKLSCDSLDDVIKTAESRAEESGAPEHYKQEGFEL